MRLPAKVRRRTAGILAVALTAVACTPSIEQSVTLPAKNDAAARLTTVAVAPFTGQNGGFVADTFRDVLADSATVATARQAPVRAYTVQFPDFPPITDREALAPHLLEQAQQSGLTGLYTGVVKEFIDRSFTEIEFRDRCRDFDSLNRCIRLATRRIYCERTHINLHLQVKLHDVTRNEIVYDRDHSGRRNERVCEDEPGYDLRHVTVRQLLYRLLTDIRRDVAPYAVSLDLPFRDKSSGLKGDANATFNKAAEAMREGNSAAACALWSELPAPNKNVAFNLALCTELSGDFAAAESQYRRLVSGLTGNAPLPDDLTDALERIQQRRQADRQLSGIKPVTD